MFLIYWFIGAGVTYLFVEAFDKAHDDDILADTTEKFGKVALLGSFVLFWWLLLPYTIFIWIFD